MTWALPHQTKGFPLKRAVWAFVRMYVNPLTKNIVPSVAMNAGIRTRATKEPLHKPMTPPRATAVTNAGNTPATFATDTATHAQSAWVEPTDKSNVPAMIAKVMPIAETPTNALWRRTLTKLSTLAKRGVLRPAISQMVMVTTAVPNRSQRRSQSTWLIGLPVAGASGILDLWVCRILKFGGG